jgi:hypothetical protein
MSFHTNYNRTSEGKVMLSGSERYCIGFNRRQLTSVNTIIRFRDSVKQRLVAEVKKFGKTILLLTQSVSKHASK